ncbi:MAG: 5'-nucleotidase, lipoprotein e(P4) family [Bacteroidales bacterium]|nr:5'-nucleotidase, lipoprotein e(P4) family [Bacteroidales bacterium]
MKIPSLVKGLSWALLVIIVITDASCRRAEKQGLARTDAGDTMAAADTLIQDNAPDNAYLLMATLYHQQSAEYKALCLQSFRMAREALIRDLADRSVDKPRAIITDIDESVLDNSPFQAACILDNTDYPVGWDEWCDMAMAKPVPGSLEFLKLAAGYGLDIFYVTNRKDHLRESTLKNLIALGYPDADSEHLVMRTGSSDKEERRQAILEKFHVSLLIGDNLGDFSSAFHHSDPEARANALNTEASNFGARYIILPNAMYGDWESAFYRGRNDLNDKTRQLILYDMLISPERLNGH